MKNIFSKESVLKLKSYLFAHKIITAIVIIVIIFGGYKLFIAKSTTGQTLYILGTVNKGTIISTVSASGQVSVTNQLDIKPKVSGDITWVGVKPGDKVYAGQAIVAMDNTTAKQAVASAEANLAASKLQFQKDHAQAPIDYQKATDALATDKENLSNEYNNTFNAISNTYLDLPNIITGAQNTLYGYDLSVNRTQSNVDALLNFFNNEVLVKVQVFATSAENDYATARAKYDPAILAYKQTDRSSPASAIEARLDQSIDTTTAIAQALQSELNFLGTVTDVANQYNIHVPTIVSTMQTNARAYLSTTNSDLSTLLAEKKSLIANKQAITTDEQNITLLQVGNSSGTNPISLQISQNSLDKQAQDLENLKTTLRDYTVVAPFGGTISTVAAKVGDTASGAVATIITNEQVVVLSVNEVDAVKINLGNKATLTFDAIDGLTLTGKVAQIDSVGTVSQGVVSYSVKIAFDSQDVRVKPGMTVNASIQTAVHPDVLVVPSSAVKTTNGTSYIQIFTPPLATTTGTTGITSVIAPEQVPVQTGISDDSNVEIISGVSEGEQIVTRTTLSTATKTTTAPSATSLLRGTGGGRIGG